MMRRQLLIVFLFISLIGGQVSRGAVAYFSDSEQDAGNTFAAATEWAWYLYPDAAVDETDGSYNLSEADLEDLDSSNDRRYTTQNKWDAVYSDDESLSFTFPDIATGRTIVSVSITVEWQRGPKVDEVRLKVFDGLGSEQIYALTLPPNNNQDYTETIDISAFIDTVQKVNDLEVWFQAMSSKGDTTGHDLVEVKVVYE